MSDEPKVEPVAPRWRYRTPKDYPINKIPDSRKFVMTHAHIDASMRMLIQSGVVLPRWPQQEKVELILTYTDVKQLVAGETIEKEFKCVACGEVETYRFHARRPDEDPLVEVRQTLREGKNVN